MADARPLHAPQPAGATGVVVFADGRTVWGQGFGAEGEAVGELCFNTAMTGYQEVMTDPSYAKQVIAFTFPHIGNVGANDEDVEAGEAHALGCLVREVVTEPSAITARTRASPTGCAKSGRIGIAGVDTRALTRLVRTRRAAERSPSRIARTASSISTRCRQMAADWPGLEGMDLAKEVSRAAGRALERRQVGAGGRAMSSAATTRAGRTSSRSIMAPSATSSATWSRPARG